MSAPVRIDVDLNSRARSARNFAPGYAHISPGEVARARSADADGPVAVGDKVEVVSDDITGDGVIIGELPVSGKDYRLIFIAVDWHSFRDTEPS